MASYADGRRLAHERPSAGNHCKLVAYSMAERRFTDPEIRTIFERATDATRVEQHRSPAASEGMTLAELQEIGREVGISPEGIERAANLLTMAPAREPRRFLGLPMGVERTVELGRRFTDDEWEQLVVLLRETFNARGRATQQGSLRQWTNGNLQALLEPTANGQRVRMRTFKGDAPVRLVTGGGMLAVSLIALVAAVVRGATGDTGMVVAIAALGGMGAMMLGTTIARLPHWARLRAQQMDSIAERLGDNV